MQHWLKLSWRTLLLQVDVEKPLGLKLKAAKGPNGGLTVEVSTCMSSLLPAFCAHEGSTALFCDLRTELCSVEPVLPSRSWPACGTSDLVTPIGSSLELRESC